MLPSPAVALGAVAMLAAADGGTGAWREEFGAQTLPVGFYTAWAPRLSNFSDPSTAAETGFSAITPYISAELMPSGPSNHVLALLDRCAAVGMRVQYDLHTIADSIHIFCFQCPGAVVFLFTNTELAFTWTALGRGMTV
eukprot:COSAG06_NODE_9519_length_1880_cov_3.705222_3_plen_139_part_00